MTKGNIVLRPSVDVELIIRHISVNLRPPPCARHINGRGETGSTDLVPGEDHMLSLNLGAVPR